MFHTIKLEKRDLSNVDESHHEISSYGLCCLREFKGGNIVVIEEMTELGPVFSVVDKSQVVEHNDGSGTRKTSLAFAHWSKEVENLDDDNNDPYCSDEAMCFQFSDHLKWNDVDLILKQGSSGQFQAPTIHRLKEALNHVYICAWCVLDI